MHCPTAVSKFRSSSRTECGASSARLRVRYDLRRQPTFLRAVHAFGANTKFPAEPTSGSVMIVPP
jgi:hypothetical protein